MKEKRYKKNALRLRLSDAMGQNVSPMEFSRWLKIFCETCNLPENIMRAKELDSSLAEAFGSWLGYRLL